MLIYSLFIHSCHFPFVINLCTTLFVTKHGSDKKYTLVWGCPTTKYWFKFKKFEKKLLPKDIDYTDVKGLRTEAIQKLNDIRPMSIGQASRISGVSPADISVLLIYLEYHYGKKEKQDI